MSAIAALNFVPNPNTRRLSLGKTLTIAAIVPWFTRPAEVEQLRGVENTLAESDYDLVLYNVETPVKRDAYFHDVPRSERADGVLIISLSPRDDDVDRLIHSTVPVVLVDANHPALQSLNRVITDNVAEGAPLRSISSIWVTHASASSATRARRRSTSLPAAIA